MKRIHFFQHVPFEASGMIDAWAQERGFLSSTTRFFDGHPADMKDADWLVVMGGPMGVGDDARYPWLNEEKKVIRYAIRSGKVVLGICLGAQLIAEALGASVRRNLHREIGWYPVFLNRDALDLDISQKFPPQWEALHWHNDTFDIPDGARLLASSEACRNQGFVYRDRVVALQFHLEMARPDAQALIDHCADELDADGFVQTKWEILGEHAPFDASRQLMARILEYLDDLPAA